MNSRQITFLILFLIIVVLESVLLAYLVIDRRMVLGHDGFELLAHQWFFVNSKVVYGQIPFWTPFMAQGTPAWWYFIYSRMDIFTNVLMLFSCLIKNTHFLPLFYSALVFDKFILLAGVWLLAKRYFGSPLTVFFVASTVMASTITMTQNSFTLILFYAVPLIIYLLHRFFDAWDWKWLFLAVFFYCTISINTFYFFPIISLAVFLYFFVFYCRSFPFLIKDFKIRRSDLIWIMLTICWMLIFPLILFIGKDPLMVINAPDRLLDGHVSLKVFLSYGQQTNFVKWWELCLGVSPNLDYTLYIGVLSLPLIVLGAFFGKNAYKRPFLWGTVFFLLFSCPSIVAKLAYYGWPFMKFYRHIGFIAPLIKLYLCFLAGFGFEQLFDKEQEQGAKSAFYKSLFCALFLLILMVFLDYLLMYPLRILHLLNSFSSRTNTILINYSPRFFTDAVMKTSFYLLGGMVLFALRSLIKSNERVMLFALIFVLYHVLDVYGYAFGQLQLRSFHLTKQQYDLTKFQNIPYAVHRKGGDEITSPREIFVQSLYGYKLDSFNNFSFSDLVKPKEITDVSLKQYHQLLDIFDNRADSPVLLKLSGATEDKIQFFTQAHLVPSNQDITLMMKDHRYKGDLLFYRPGQTPGIPTTNGFKDLDLSLDERINIPYQVLYFSPNKIIIKADTTTHPGVWLEYGDQWYPFWKARVNGVPREVLKGNLIYKTLALERGVNEVVFYIENNSLTVFYYFFMFSSLFWLVIPVFILLCSFFKE